MNFERVRLSASDGWVLVGDYYPANGSKGVVLMHVLPALKESWRDFALELQRNGISSIALDARGHGESAVPRSFLEFSEADQQKRVLDVQAAEGFLRSRGKTAIFGVGASIGANAVLVYESEWNSLDGIVLLSPGLDYRGLKTKDAARALGKPCLILVGKGDSYSWNSSRELASESNLIELREFDSQEHGTNLFSINGVSGGLVEWISSK